MKVYPPTRNFACVSTTRNVATTGEQIISGLPFKARSIMILAVINGTQSESEGVADLNTSNNCKYYAVGSSNKNSSTNYCAWLETAAGNYAVAQFTGATATTLSLTWAKAGTPTGTAQLLLLIFG